MVEFGASLIVNEYSQPDLHLFSHLSARTPAVDGFTDGLTAKHGKHIDLKSNVWV